MSRASKGYHQETQQYIQVSPITSTSTYKITATIHNLPVSFNLDTGSDVTLIRRDIWEVVQPSDCQLIPWTGPRLVGVEGTPLHVHGYTNISIKLEKDTFHMRITIVDSLTTEAIMGMDFLEESDCTIDIAKKHEK